MSLEKFFDSQLGYVLSNSLFYQQKFKGINKKKLSLTASFEHLPFTTKTELLDDQLTYPPLGSNICVSIKNITRIHKTSGTTNKPLLLALTGKDIENTVRIGSACFKLSGLKNSDIVIHCLNYNMWAGGYTDHQSLERTGAAVIPFGVGHTKELIETILFIKPAVIHCTPSYLKKIETILSDSFHLKPAELKLRLGLFGGEPGLENKDFRNYIESTWNIKAMNANYGMADVLSMFGAECLCQDGLHFMGDELLFAELIDSTSLANIAIEAGATGELVLTNLNKEAQPLIRYRTKDIIRIISTGKCICGTTGFKFEIVGRSDDMIIVKGVNVFLSAIEKIINNHLNILTGQFQVHINKFDPIDRIILVLELKEHNFYNHKIVRNMISTEFKEQLFINPDICFKHEKELPLTEGKTKKLFRIL